MANFDWKSGLVIGGTIVGVAAGLAAGVGNVALKIDEKKQRDQQNAAGNQDFKFNEIKGNGFKF